MRSPHTGDVAFTSRPTIHARLERMVLISPLWATLRNGWAIDQDGKVFVEYRWWKMANEVSNLGSRRSQ